MPVVTIESIEVFPDRVTATVRVAEERFMRTSRAPDFAARAASLLPELSRHRCDNPAEKPVLEELADTETPHALEHIAFELMALSGSPRTLKGETSWDFSRDGRGVFRVSLAYDDDLVALGALRAGVRVLDWLFGLDSHPDVRAIVRELRAARGA